MKIRAFSAAACALWLTHCSHAPTTLEAQAPTASQPATAPAASTRRVLPPRPPRARAYPAARKDEVVDDYHGTQVADPYRWLENPDSPESRQWIEAQNQLTFGYLEKIPVRAQIKQRLTELWDYEKYGVPWREGNRYFFTRNDGLQNQSVLYTADSLEAEPRVLLDPNTLSADGTVALAGTAISEDGNLLAYGLAAAGSDWKEIRVRDVRTGKDLAGRHQVGEVLRRLLDEGRQGLLLQPLRRAEGRRGHERRQLLPEALLPPARHAAGRGRAGLRAPGPEGVGLRRLRHRRRPLPGHPRLAGHRARRTSSSTRT